MTDEHIMVAHNDDILFEEGMSSFDLSIHVYFTFDLLRHYPWPCKSLQQVFLDQVLELYTCLLVECCCEYSLIFRSLFKLITVL